ncbi:ankyrin repeat protein [Fusarium flagelliforme]|uniref:ankyrin repeat protein n=1 Tax=Fusarium flagelliforme TaxID=2675880 RepID=UPI001E8DBE5A|nr:ankyrin repeat protein [Fusarium flagelliforme]KAH7188143.1 ankyrin repeat protein [Fusarium flagelliforme]
MASHGNYTVGWVCALPIEAAAAKAALDRVHDNLSQEQNPGDSNSYILGSLRGHNVVVAYPNSKLSVTTSLADVVEQLHASYTSIRFHLMVGIAGGAPNTKEDIRLGDVVVSKSTTGRPGIIQFDENGDRTKDQLDRSRVPTPVLLAAAGKAETAAIFDESKMRLYISEITMTDPSTFVCPGLEQDVLFESNYDHVTTESGGDSCSHCDLAKVQSRQHREAAGPIVHQGLMASSHHLRHHTATRDRLAHDHGILCFDTDVPELRDAAQYLIIRGICDYSDSHKSKIWHAYAAAASAAYAKEVISFIPTVSKTIPLATSSYTEAAPVLDALLLTRPEVDRKSLIALKGRRVDGTCEWLTQHPHYQEWLKDENHSLLWVSGGPGKGKTMLAIYITEMLQPMVGAGDNVLLYYFCSNRDKNRNTALTIMRGILHQWVGLRPQLAKFIKSSFEGTETTKYTTSNFLSLWRVFLTLLQQSTSSQVVCVLDGLDECERESLKQLLDAVSNYLSQAGKRSGPQLKVIILSRPRPAVLESKLSQYRQIQLDASATATYHDVERYIFAKVAELASEQDLSENMVAQIQKTLLAGADGTFLWVGFVVNELRGGSWSEIGEVLRHVPKGLGGIYQRLLQQVVDKEALVPILPWVVLAARPLTLEELTVAAGITASGTIPATQVTKHRLRLSGLLVKIEGDVVNLVHESAKEFFQSDQVDIQGINMFRMNQNTHKSLMHTCLTHIERRYGNPRSDHEPSSNDSFLSYASQYWPVHFHHAIHVIDKQSEFSRPFFQVDSPIREEWWKLYWEQEKNGGSPPSFTLLHLAAYFGNIPWAKLLIHDHARLVARKDNYGRTPLSWAVNQGHRDMVELLLDHGARVNYKDRSMLTPLHIAVTGQHKGLVSILLEHGANLEAKAEHGDTDTPLMRAILADSTEMTQELLERGARVDKLPALLGVASLKGHKDPMDERVKELLGFQDQVFLARFKRSSRYVDMVMKSLGFSLRLPLALELMSLYLKFVALNRWDSLSVLQELVQENKQDELREWARLYHVFFLEIIAARNPKKLKAMGDLATQILQRVAPKDLQALLAITTFTGMQTKLAAITQGWKEGDIVTAAAISDWASIACDRDALEFFHFGIREFLSDFDDCVRNGNAEEAVFRTTALMTSHFALVDKNEHGPIEYFSRVVAEFFEGYIASGHDVELFSHMNQAFAIELTAISETRDSARLRVLLTTVVQFAQKAHEKGQDRFLDVPSAACLILCQENASNHEWLISEAIPEVITSLIAKESPGLLRKRACKTFVECLVIGKQYGLALLKGAHRQNVEQHLQCLPEVGQMMNRILRS